MSRIDRNKRERKLERRKPPAPSRVHNPEPVNDPGRGSTFRAARARRQLALDLESVGYTAPDKPARRARTAAPLTLDRTEPSAPEKKRPAATAKPAQPDQPTMRDRPTCKGRPASSKGNGSSRPFVPWCS